MTDIKKDELEKKEIEAETEQRKEGGCGCVKPSSDLYSEVEGVDEAGVEIPTEDAVVEAREWIEENRM